MLDDDHIINLNPNRIIECLRGILEESQLNLIRKEVNRHAHQLIRLGRSHLLYARRSKGHTAWRHRISRGYYACYSASKAVRLIVVGVYSKESDDHKKIGDLPKDFPDASIWKDLLVKFRSDRNLADYDHAASLKDLELTPREYLENASKFLAISRSYLKKRGVF